MRYVDRLLRTELVKASKAFPAMLLTGPRQCGKTTLLRHVFPGTTYVLLEDPDVIARVRSDPRTFLDEFTVCHPASLLPSRVRGAMTA